MGCDDKTQDITKSLTDLELDLDKFLEEQGLVLPDGPLPGAVSKSSKRTPCHEQKEGPGREADAECVWMATKQGQKNLTEGYLPVARLVLGKMRRMLYRMVKAVGGLALGVRTDCVYVAAEHEAAAKALLLAAGFRFGGTGWDVVGSLKIDRKDDIDGSILRC